jgi:hypothetical protein
MNTQNTTASPAQSAADAARHRLNEALYQFHRASGRLDGAVARLTAKLETLAMKDPTHAR